MRNSLFSFHLSRTTIVCFWIVVLAIFAGIYFFNPSLFNRMQQVTYDGTPYVNTPARG